MVCGCHILCKLCPAAKASDAVPGGRIKWGYVKCGSKLGTATATALLHNKFYAT